ncbi:MAG: exodeoxyribonuclease V subunit gamma [Firmicutes bacterium]|nr:exodeoxyribonuclease V subunit gamma [Bacillota bacterium]
MNKKVYFSQDYQKLENSLFSNLKQTGDNTADKQALVIVPSFISSVYLKKHFKLSGVKFLRIKDLATSLGESELIRRKKEPVPYKGEECIARLSAARTIGPGNRLFKFRNSKGLPELLMSFLKDFRQGGFESVPNPDIICSSFEQQALSSGIIPEPDRIKTLFNLFNAFRLELSEKYYDVEDAEYFAGKNASAFSAIFNTSNLHVFGFSKFDETEKTLIERLSAHTNIHLYISHLSGNPICDETEQWLMETGFSRENCSSAGNQTNRDNLKILKDELFRENKDENFKANYSDNSVKILCCPDAPSEVREIAREILNTAAAEKIRFENMAVILADPSYGELFTDIFEQAGIPAYFHDGFTIDQTPSGKCLKLLLNLINSDMERFRVSELINTGRLNLEKFFKDQSKPVPAMWDYISKKAGVRKGRDEWKSRLFLYEKNLERKIADPLYADEADDLKTELEQVVQLSRFIFIFKKELHSFGNSNTWKEYTKNLFKLFYKFIKPDQNANNLAKLLARLKNLENIEESVTFNDFRVTVKDILENETIQEKSFMQGAVNVLNPKSPAGTAYDAVFICGMQGGVFPKSPGENPLLPDEERIILNSLLKNNGKIALRNLFVNEDPIAFAMLVSSCRKQIVLSYARNKTGENKPQAPSHFILEAGKALTGKHCFYDDVKHIPGYIHKHRSFEGKPVSFFTDKGSYININIHQAKQNNDSRVFSLFENYCSNFKNAVNAYRQRRETPSPGLWDGVISDQVLQKIISDELNHKGLISSPTAIESYFRCPYSFFIKRILKLRKLDAPESIKAISALDKGNIYHEVYQQFYGNILDNNGSMPCDSNRVQYVDMIKTLAADCLQKAEKMGLTGSQISWFAEKTAILNSIEKFVDQEIQNKSGQPAHLEFSMGCRNTNGAPSMTNPVQFDLGNGKKLSIYGRIDRIDIDADNNLLTVIDYKTGKSTTYKPNSLRGGEQMQLFLYLSLIRQASSMFVDLDVKEGVYYFSTIKGEFKKIAFSGDNVQNRYDDALKLLLWIYDALDQGIFIPWTGVNGKNCENCDFSSLCPQDITTIEETKKPSNVYNSFSELKEIT